MGKTALLLTSLAASLLLACSVALVALDERAQAAFPGMNGRIVFASDRDGDFDIYTVSFNGNNLKRLTNNTSQDLEPSWSADGRRIVYWRIARGNAEIHKMAANGTGSKKIGPEFFRDGAIFRGASPVFSPGGGQIAFSACNTAYTMKADGTGVRRLAGEGCLDNEDPVFAYSDPDWSPDGRTIAVTRGAPNGSDVSVIRLADRSVSPVNEDCDVAFPCRGARNPDWSPDGARLAYVVDGGVSMVGADGAGDAAVAPAVDAPGSNGCTRFFVSASECISPAFSPGGGQIVFASGGDGDFDLYVAQDDGSEVRQLTNSRFKEISPDWQAVR